MFHKKGFSRSKQGLETVTAVFMLLLLFAAMTVLIVAFLNYDLSAQKQMQVSQERAREQIAITKIGISSDQKIMNVTISNTGGIETNIKALYRQLNGDTTFLIDPSTYIEKGSFKTIDTSGLELTVEPDSVFIAATERGVKSIGVSEIGFEYGEIPGTMDTSGLSIGPLKLSFNSLNWTSCDSNGNIISGWQQKWTIPTGTCSWRLSLTNVDSQNRSISLNQHSGFTISLVGFPSTTTWYQKVATYTVAWNETSTIEFLWDQTGTAAQTAGASQAAHGGVNNVFLTLIGNYSDGETFSQTIPFEAITIV